MTARVLQPPYNIMTKTTEKHVSKYPFAQGLHRPLRHHHSLNLISFTAYKCLPFLLSFIWAIVFLFATFEVPAIPCQIFVLLLRHSIPDLTTFCPGSWWQFCSHLTRLPSIPFLIYIIIAHRTVAESYQQMPWCSILYLSTSTCLALLGLECIPQELFCNPQTTRYPRPSCQ